jgi:hypothetical protein
MKGNKNNYIDAITRLNILQQCKCYTDDFLLMAANEYAKQKGNNTIELEPMQVLSREVLVRVVFAAVIKTSIYDEGKGAYWVDGKGHYYIKV